MHDWQAAFVDFLLDADALRLGAFTLKSGRTSPVFLNTGLLDTGARLSRLGEAYADTVLEQVGADGFDVVFGPAYKGIPLAVAMAIALGQRGVEKPFLADRKEAKTHGGEASDVPFAKQLLGRPPAADARFVMVDDVLTTGGTKFEAIEFLKSGAAQSQVVALLVVMDRQETMPDGRDAVASFTEQTGVPVTPVLTLTETLDHLAATGRLGDGDLARCKAYWGEFGTPAAKAWAAQ